MYLFHNGKYYNLKNTDWIDTFKDKLTIKLWYPNREVLLEYKTLEFYEKAITKINKITIC